MDLKLSKIPKKPQHGLPITHRGAAIGMPQNSGGSTVAPFQLSRTGVLPSQHLTQTVIPAHGGGNLGLTGLTGVHPSLAGHAAHPLPKASPITTLSDRGLGLPRTHVSVSQGQPGQRVNPIR